MKCWKFWRLVTKNYTKPTNNTTNNEMLIYWRKQNEIWCTSRNRMLPKTFLFSHNFSLKLRFFWVFFLYEYLIGISPKLLKWIFNWVIRKIASHLSQLTNFCIRWTRKLRSYYTQYALYHNWNIVNCNSSAHHFNLAIIRNVFTAARNGGLSK